MKISKLFHWLYGLVMLLPIFAIGVTCGYAMFNKNAKDSYYGENINQIQYLEVSSNENINSNKTYYFYGSNALSTDYSGTIYYTSAEFVTGLPNVTNEQIEFIGNSIRLYYYRGTSITFYDNENNSLALAGTGIIKLNGLLKNPTSTNTFRMIKEIQYNKNSFVSEVFYYSVERVTQSNLFNWSYDSFLVAPFTYIVALFSMPTNSPVVMLLSYWLAISIIWLVFDLVMYVPLLVHRWLDKGVLE